MEVAFGSVTMLSTCSSHHKKRALMLMVTITIIMVIIRIIVLFHLECMLRHVVKPATLEDRNEKHNSNCNTGNQNNNNMEQQ